MGIVKNTGTIETGNIYHIYNRAVGNDKLFTDTDHYLKFLAYMKVYMVLQADIYAYCLLPNHFHLLLCVTGQPDNFSKAMADVCSAYAKYFNAICDRRGSLFSRPFKRKVIETDAELASVTWYIHHNPQHHYPEINWQYWPWSSYPAYLKESKTVLKTEFLIQFFGSRTALIAQHRLNNITNTIGETEIQR